MLLFLREARCRLGTLSYRCQSDGDDLWLWDLEVWKISVIFADIYPPLP